MSTATAEKSVICRHTGCGRKFEGKHAIQAELMHFHRAHSRKILMSYEAGAKGKGKKKGTKTKKGKGSKARLGIGRFSLRNGHASLNGTRLVNLDGHIDRRSKEWRNQKKALALNQETVNFCPNCLTDLQATARGLVKSNQLHMKVNGCPKCGCRVSAVAEEIIAARHS